MVESLRKDLEKSFTIAYIPSASASENELYQATDNVESGLMLSADKKINSNQIIELNIDNPFIRLTYNSSAVVDLSADSDEYSDIDSSETKVFDVPVPEKSSSSSATSICIKEENARKRKATDRASADREERTAPQYDNGVDTCPTLQHCMAGPLPGGDQLAFIKYHGYDPSASPSPVRVPACIPKPDPVSQRNLWYASDDSMPELITD